MLKQRYSTILVLVLMVTQVLGPAVLWAAEERGVQIKTNERMIISAMIKGTLTAETRNESRPLHFGEAVKVGDELQTGKNTVAEVLIGKRAIITLGGDTITQLTELSPEQLTIQLVKGMVRVAASADALGEKGTVIIQTPISQVKTHGGIVRVRVNAESGSVAQAPVGAAKPYLASFPARTIIAANNADTDIIQVDEGIAEILGAGANGQALAVASGQSMTRRVGQAGLMTEGKPQDTMRAGILSNADHAYTPKEGVENLVALQVNQATQLGQVLTGASKTEAEQSENKQSSENPINGATGGVQVATNNQSSNGGNTSNPTNPPPTSGPGNPPSVVATLFGGGTASNSTTANPTESTGSGYGGNSNNGLEIATSRNTMVNVNGPERVSEQGKTKALLVFTSKEPVQPFLEGNPCDENCLDAAFIDLINSPNLSNIDFNDPDDLRNNVRTINEEFSKKLVFRPLGPVVSKFTVKKELVLIGGEDNVGHGGEVPTETLIVRGAAPLTDGQPFTNLAASTASTGVQDQEFDGLYPTDRLPAKIGLFPSLGSTIFADAGREDLEEIAEVPPEIVRANSTFVVQNDSRSAPGDNLPFVGGTLGQFSNDPTSPPDSAAVIVDNDASDGGLSRVDGAITATSSTQVPVVTLTGGVALDRGAIATIGTTDATDNFFTNPNTNIPGAQTFNGSLLAVIDGPNGVSTSVTVEDRLLGVYDGSQILTPEGDGNKALLSVLDDKLKGPSNGAPLIDINAAFKDADPDTTNGRNAAGARPNVRVTSAVVTRSTKALPAIPLDSGLLEASAPILALTMADMTTTSHFAGVVGKFEGMAADRPLSLKLNDVMVALNASNLLVENGNLLNLNNATATIGYLFSLNNSSTLGIGVGEGNGTLFSLNNGAALNLTENALGVFGSGSNTLAIKNNLCAGACGNLVNRAGEVFKLPNGSTLQAAGVTQDVVLPDGFNPFALADGAPTPKITVEGALFEVKNGSTLNISGTTVVGAPVQ